MKVIQFKINDEKVRIGVIKDEDVIEIDHISNDTLNPLVDFLRDGNELENLGLFLENPTSIYSISKVKLLPPITKPEKIICIGLNYKDHCDETEQPYPEVPVVFSKYSSSIIGPGDNVEIPTVSEQIDWEAELVVVIGKTAKSIKKEDALDYVFGYTAAQDISARDLQFQNGGQFLLGKTIDTFCPIGPCIVTKDEIPDPHELNIKTTVNGTIKQKSNTEQLIHGVDGIIEYVSRMVTLHPGDIILTGTPGGVGFTRDPKQFLKSGDVIETEIDVIGKLVNYVI